MAGGICGIPKGGWEHTPHPNAYRTPEKIVIRQNSTVTTATPTLHSELSLGADPKREADAGNNQPVLSAECRGREEIEMATQTNQEPTTREEVMIAFETLLERHREQRNQINTRAETLAREEENDIVTRASTYSVEGLVKELADLQLAFGTSLDQLGDMLLTEDVKLDELKRSISVEERQLERLQDVEVAAEALELLQRENQKSMGDFDADRQKKLDALSKRIEQTREAWELEQIKHEREVREYIEQRDKERQLAEADFAYTLERDRKVAADRLEQRRRKIEHDLEELEASLTRDWEKREASLAKKAGEISTLEQRVETFPEEKEEKVKEARASSIRKTTEDARVEAQLMQQQYEADEQVSELKIASLENSITEQRQQIAELEEKLLAASTKAQDLAVKAIEGTSRQSA